LRFVETSFRQTFHFHSLRMRYEASEGSMLIDVSTVASLELIQNLHNAKSEACLFGLLNQTQTKMGARLLRNNILQPLTEGPALNSRFDALEELTTREEIFFGTRAGSSHPIPPMSLCLLIMLTALKEFLDIDRLLTWVRNCVVLCHFRLTCQTFSLLSSPSTQH